MQILEYSSMGLRSARINLVSRHSEIVITLFPMVHVGEADFYRRVYDDAFSHDVVLVEGIRSPITTRVTRVYRWMVGSKRLRLSLQPPVPAADTVNARIIHADLTGEEFRVVWEKVPQWLRLLVYLVAPAMGLWMRAFGTRESIAKRMAQDDQPSRDELLNLSPESGALEGAILGARDVRLIEHLERILDDPSGQIQRLAVVYGAGHVRAVLRAVTTGRGYFAEHGAWLTVFSL